MPKIPKGFIRKRPRKTLSKPKRKEVARIARKVLRGTMETKVAGGSGENIQLFHNKPFYQGNMLYTTQGPQDNNDLTAANPCRIGDEILLRNINLRLWISNKLDRPNVMYKVALFWYDEGATLNDALCYFTQQNKMLDRYNTEQISIIAQKTIFSKEMYLNGTEKFEHSQLVTLNKNWKGKKIVYENNGTQVKKRNIGWLVACYDAYGTLQTDNIASFAFNFNMRFQDP